MRDREGDLDRIAAARVKLFGGDAILESVDDDVFLQMPPAFVDQGDGGCVKFVFDGENGSSPKPGGAARVVPRRPICQS